VDGRIEVDGTSIAGARPEDVAARGLTMVPEGRHIFQTLTVAENLKVAADLHDSKKRLALDRVFDLFPILKDRFDMRAGNLSGGEQQQLAIARALIMEPRMIMVDEPSLGLAPLVIDAVYACFRRLREEGVTLLIVEQSTARILHLADRVYVMKNGAVVISDRPDKLDRTGGLEQAYFGRGRANAAP
jgi:branched-chain amino acid transport system ATP-binding protein